MAPERKHHDSIVRPGGVNRVLLGVLILSIPFGALGFLGDFGIPWAYPLSALVAISFLAIQTLGRAAESHVRGALLLGEVLAIVMLLLQCARGGGLAELYAASSFVVGTLSGIAVAYCWQRDFTSVSIVDRALGGFLSVATLQVAYTQFFGFSSLRELHSLAVLPWGRSNFIAGMMVVGSFLMIGRLQQTRAASRLIYLVPLLAMVAALMLLSRGSVVALTVGLVVMSWRLNVGARMRIVLRLLGVVAVAVGVYALQLQTSIRSVDGYEANANVDVRFALYQAAWEHFKSSPVIGTGWLSMRDALSGVTVSYAHNILLSYLQIAGLVGGLFVAVILLLAWRCRKADAGIVAAYCSALALAMSDPVAEGLVGAILLWAALSNATLSQPELQDSPRKRT